MAESIELWDAYDKDMNRIEGVKLVRGEPIPDGMYHLVCDIAVRHSDGSWLLMRRHPVKPFGDRWELSAGGSALSGEPALEAAKRELFEETGIENATFSELGRIIHKQLRDRAGSLPRFRVRHFFRGKRGCCAGWRRQSGRAWLAVRQSR